MESTRQPDYKMAVRMAEEVLEDNFVRQPPVRVDQIVEAYGLSVLRATLTGPFEDVAGFIDLDNRCVVVNSKDAVTRQTFTLAHELAHWLMHQDVLREKPEQSILLRRPIGKANSDPLEKEANCFAANLLVPDRFLDRFVGAAPRLLAKMFSVSPDVMGYRLENRRHG